ncbi:MAG: DMT family transporter [Candidatus Puniceispirillaceae bacterium]
MTGLWNSPHFTLTMAMWMWAGHTIAARLSVGEMSPMVMMGFRWMACLAILAFIFRRQMAVEWPRVRARLGWVAAMGGLGMAGFTFFFILAAQYTTAINLGITQSSVPMIVMLMSLVAFGTRIGVVQLLGLVVSFIGVLVLVTTGSLEILASLTFNRGDLLMLVACVCYAGYTVGLSRRIDMPPALMLAFFAVPATLVFLFFMGLEFWRGEMVLPGIKGLFIVAYCAIFPSMLAQIFFMRGVELAGANRSGFYLNLIPVFSAIMGVIFLAESLHLYHAASLAMVLGGIYLAERHKVRA